MTFSLDDAAPQAPRDPTSAAVPSPGHATADDAAPHAPGGPPASRSAGTSARDGSGTPPPAHPAPSASRALPAATCRGSGTPPPAHPALSAASPAATITRRISGIPAPTGTERATAGAAIVGALPKVLLHDHLDGGLRPATILELAAGIGHDLPATDPVALGRWFVEAASAGSLERYLETFEHTLAVMQTTEALARVAREAALDLAGDGVIYAELRFAPELHQRAGLELGQVVDAVLAGIDEGTAEAHGRGQTIRVGLILDAMRQADHSERIARLALAKRARVAGFDIAGPETGHPVLHHMAAFTLLHEASFPITIHAGEADGLGSMWQAVTKGQAQRIGHGVSIVQDIAGLGLPGSPAGPYDEEGMSGGMRAAHVPPAAGADSGAVGGEFAELGALAHWIRDWGIVLEMCPSSNVQTGAADSITAHPITPLKHLGFPVTINTDNRLMSGTSMTREATLLMAEAGWTLADLRDAAVTAIGGAFIHADERAELLEDVILPAYAAALGVAQGAQ